MSQDELLSLFPTPVLIAPYPVPYDKELKFIQDLPCRRENKGEGMPQTKFIIIDSPKTLLY